MKPNLILTGEQYWNLSVFVPVSLFKNEVAGVTGCALWPARWPGSLYLSRDWPLSPKQPSVIRPSAWYANADWSAVLPYEYTTESNWVVEAGRERRCNGERRHIQSANVIVICWSMLQPVWGLAVQTALHCPCTSCLSLCILLWTAGALDLRSAYDPR